LAILVFFGLWAYNNVFYYVLSGKCKILTILWLLILTQLLLFWRVFVDRPLLLAHCCTGDLFSLYRTIERGPLLFLVVNAVHWRTTICSPLFV